MVSNTKAMVRKAGPAPRSINTGKANKFNQTKTVELTPPEVTAMNTTKASPIQVDKLASGTKSRGFRVNGTSAKHVKLNARLTLGL